jgi:hypothetical protein
MDSYSLECSRRISRGQEGAAANPIFRWSTVCDPREIRVSTGTGRCRRLHCEREHIIATSARHESGVPTLLQHVINGAAMHDLGRIIDLDGGTLDATAGGADHPEGEDPVGALRNKPPGARRIG